MCSACGVRRGDGGERVFISASAGCGALLRPRRQALPGLVSRRQAARRRSRIVPWHSALPQQHFVCLYRSSTAVARESARDKKDLGAQRPGPPPPRRPGPQGTPRTGIAPSAAPSTHSARHVWRHTKARSTSGLAMLNPSNRAHYAPTFRSLPATHRSPTPPTKKSCSRTTDPNALPHQ